MTVVGNTKGYFLTILAIARSMKYKLQGENCFAYTWYSSDNMPGNRVSLSRNQLIFKFTKFASGIQLSEVIFGIVADAALQVYDSSWTPKLGAEILDRN